ncbi:uncharacterized protein [Amphiura filiformis]|uniref:uncharacterized protein n=1 Tax=Amphiura filiformis TaxID=82378 RepID=UPI003B20C7F9
MKMNLVLMVVGVFIMFCNSANSETENCVALCNHCVEVSDTLSNMRCTKHCEKLKQTDGEISCSKLTAPNKGSPLLEYELELFHARMSELVKSGDYSTIVEELYADECVLGINGQAPAFGKEDVTQAWFEFLGSNPSVNRMSYTRTAFGEDNGKVWEDGIINSYQDDALVGSFRDMNVYKRINGKLILIIEIAF